MSLYGFGGRCLNIREVCMDFEPCFKVYNLVSWYPKSMKLGQMTNLNVIFHVVVSVYRLVTIWNSPQFPVEFRNGLFSNYVTRVTFIKWCGVYNNEWIIIFFTVLDKKTELSSSFIEASSEIGPKMKSLQAKQRTCKNIVIGREITTY